MPSVKPTKPKGGSGEIRRPGSVAMHFQLNGSGDRWASQPQWSLWTNSASQTEHLGILAGRLARGGEVLALSGDLGTGKTCFVRGLAAGLGASPGTVNSPTFVFIHEYNGRLRLAHADLFRLETGLASRDLGLDDYLNSGAVLAIEWPEKAAHELPGDRLDVRLEHKGRTMRELHFQAQGKVSKAFLFRLRRAAIRSLAQSGPAQPRPRTRRLKPR